MSALAGAPFWSFIFFVMLFNLGKFTQACPSGIQNFCSCVEIIVNMFAISKNLDFERVFGSRVANSLLSQELKLCFSDTKFTKAPYTKKDTKFFLDTK